MCVFVCVSVHVRTYNSINLSQTNEGYMRMREKKREEKMI